MIDSEHWKHLVAVGISRGWLSFGEPSREPHIAACQAEMKRRARELELARIRPEQEKLEQRLAVLRERAGVLVAA